MQNKRILVIVLFLLCLSYSYAQKARITMHQRNYLRNDSISFEIQNIDSLELNVEIRIEKYTAKGHILFSENIFDDGLILTLPAYKSSNLKFKLKPSTIVYMDKNGLFRTKSTNDNKGIFRLSAKLYYPFLQKQTIIYSSAFRIR